MKKPPQPTSGLCRKTPSLSSGRGQEGWCPARGGVRAQGRGRKHQAAGWLREAAQGRVFSVALSTPGASVPGKPFLGSGGSVVSLEKYKGG